MVNSKKLLALSFFISICIFVSVGKAADQMLATVTTDADSLSYQLSVSYSDKDQVLTSFFISNFANGSFTNRDELPIKTFIKEGINMGVHGRVTFVKINGENFDEEQGGVIIIDAVFNLLTGKRKSYEMQLAKDQTGWKLFSEGKPITKILGKSNRVPMIGVVGAKELVMK